MHKAETRHGGPLGEGPFTWHRGGFQQEIEFQFLTGAIAEEARMSQTCLIIRVTQELLKYVRSLRFLARLYRVKSLREDVESL